jgi:hypothetical protein
MASDQQKLLCFDEIGETIGTTKIIRTPPNEVQAPPLKKEMGRRKKKEPRKGTGAIFSRSVYSFPG